jgi:putative Mg2+ transporter-C (MgtC) family protein
MGLEDIVYRLGIATTAGLLMGIDRELRGIAAGLRTHALVALSSALITVSAMILYNELSSTTNIDPLRVVQGLAQAVGFVSAGAVFFAKGDVHNLTTAANIWLAAALGIAAGMGQTALVITGIGFGALILTIVRLAEAFLPGNQKAGD